MIDTGQLLLADALERVDANADDRWRAAAREAVRAVAERGGYFTTDDVWHELERTGSVTHDGRALGSVVKWAAKQGLCAGTDEYRPSRRPECHQRPVKVWRATCGHITF